MRGRSVIDAAFAIPGNLSAPTGGYAYARQLLELLPQFGVQPHHLQLSSAYPKPSEDDITATRRTFGQLHPDTPLIIDGLAYGGMPPLLVNDIVQPVIALVHHPLAYETGLSTAEKRRYLAFERHALAHAQHVVVTSPMTKRLLIQEYAVADGKITVAEPGTKPALRAQGSGSPLRLLAVGAVVPRKGYDVLVEALTNLQNEDWHLSIVGATDRDHKCTTELREAIMKSGRRAHITLVGPVDERELQRHYASADIFVMPSLFEGYGMALTEAIAHGLPIVSTTGGAVAETVPDAAALKVAPGDVDALTDALQRILGDAELRNQLAEASWSAGRELPRWEDCAAKVAGVVQSVTKSAVIKNL